MQHLREIGRAIPWTNYHRTFVDVPLDQWAFLPAGGTPLTTYLKEAADDQGQLLDRLSRDNASLRLIGSGWSFSVILGGGSALLRTATKDHVARLEPSELASGAQSRRLVLASAGTSVADVNRFLEPLASLITSGAHDGQRLGGMIGTGTHGSVLEAGAFQDQVRGIHLVTGPGRSVWIERGPDPLLLESYVKRFADRVELDEDLFDAALVHLGGLGIVNAVLLEVAEGYMLDVVRRRVPITTAQVDALAAGRFEEFARSIWADADKPPHYVEVILNPYRPVEGWGTSSASDALVTMYFMIKAQVPLVIAPEPANDALNLLARGWSQTPDANLLEPGEVAYHAVSRAFTETPQAGRPLDRKTWGQANGYHEKLTVLCKEIDLYNAAYAVDRRSLTSTLQRMFAAFGQQASAPVVATLRFVKKSRGHLAFTCFDKTAVINFDGIRSGGFADAAMRRVALALEQNGIDFTQHWGKQGAITRSRFQAGFGDPTDAKSNAGRWRTARHRLLNDETMRRVITNRALIEWGLD